MIKKLKKSYEKGITNYKAKKSAKEQDELYDRRIAHALLVLYIDDRHFSVSYRYKNNLAKDQTRQDAFNKALRDECQEIGISFNECQKAFWEAMDIS